MSKKIFFLLIVFLVLVPLCLFVMSKSITPSLSLQTITVEKILQPNPSPTPMTITSLSFLPSTLAALPGQKQTIAVIIYGDPRDDKPQIVQLEIAYDPRALLDVEIQPGDFFTQPKLLLSTQNIHTGRISYAIEETNNSTHNSQRTIANLSFLPNPNFLDKETKITFLQKTTIRGKGDKNLFMISPLASLSATIYFK